MKGIPSLVPYFFLPPFTMPKIIEFSKGLLCSFTIVSNVIARSFMVCTNLGRVRGANYERGKKLSIKCLIILIWYVNYRSRSISQRRLSNVTLLDSFAGGGGKISRSRIKGGSRGSHSGTATATSNPCKTEAPRSSPFLQPFRS